MKNVVTSRFWRSFLRFAAGALGAAGLFAGQAQGAIDLQRQQLEARVVAVRAALDSAAAEADPAGGDATRPKILAQWLNWPNWGNWNNWPNWGNWGNWFNR